MVLKKESASQPLNWHDADIENRFGLPAGKYTTPGIVGSVLFGCLMAGAVLGILFVMKDTPIADFFFTGGISPVPCLILLLSSICLAALFIKWRKIALQKRQFHIEEFNALMDFMAHWDEMTKDHARELLTGIRQIVEDPEHFLMLNRIKKALSSLRFVGEPEAVAKMLKTMAEEDDVRSQRGYRIISMAVFFILMAGLLGSFWSVYQGLFSMGSFSGYSGGHFPNGINDLGGLSELIPTLLLGKGNPLDTLTFALMSAVIIQIIGGYLKRKDLLLLDASDDYCYTHIAHAIPLSFGDRLEQIQSMIFRRRITQSVNTLWEALEADPFMEEEDARAHLKQSVDKVRKKITARRNGRLFGSIIMVSLLISSGAASFQLTQYRHLKERLNNQLQIAFDQKDFSKVKTLLDTMAATHRHLFTSAEIEKNRLKSADLKASQVAQKDKFNHAISQLEVLRLEGFNAPPDQVVQLMSEARENIGSLPISSGNKGVGKDGGKQSSQTGQIFLGEEALSKLMDLERAWEEKQFGVTQQTKEQIREIKQQLERQLQRVGDLSKPDLSFGIKVMVQMERLISEGEALENLSPTMMRSLDAYRSRLREITEQWEKRKRMLYQLAMGETMDAYFNGLDGFIKAFPNDGVNQVIQSIKRMKPFYSQFVTLPQSVSNEIEEGDGDANRDENPPRGDLFPKNIFWDDLIQANHRFDENMRQHRDEALARLKKIQQIHAFTTLWQCQVNRPNQDPETWYFLGKPTEIYVSGVKSYAGSAYVPSINEVQPKFSEKHIIIVQVEDLKMAPHCQEIAQMMARIEKGLTLERLLIEMHRVNRLPIAPILKLDLLKYFAKPLTMLAGRDNAGSFADMADLLEKSTLKHHWLCHAHPKYDAESKTATAIITDLLMKSNAVRDYMLSMKLASLSLKRLPKWVGFADLETEGEIHLKPGASPKEIWVLRQGKEVKGQVPDLKVMMAGEPLHEASMITPLDRGAYLPGEPLFAPQDDETTRNRLYQLRSDLDGIPGIVIEKWPLAWPVNMTSESIEEGAGAQ